MKKPPITSAAFGQFIKQTRKSLHITQATLAMTSGTGLRFIIDLEKGKPTCQMGKALRVIETLGIELILNSPPT